jgi:hypothetical protein
LRGVTIELKDSSIISGYVIWNEAWFAHKDYKPKFSETLVDIESLRKYFTWQADSLTIYKNVYIIDKPFKVIDYSHKPEMFLVTSDSDIGKFPLNAIKSIKAKPIEHDGYNGAGGIPIYSMKSLEMLTQKMPVAVIIEDTGVSDNYYIRYNPEIKEDELKEKKNYLQTCCSTNQFGVSSPKLCFEKLTIFVM